MRDIRTVLSCATLFVVFIAGCGDALKGEDPPSCQSVDYVTKFGDWMSGIVTAAGSDFDISVTGCESGDPRRIIGYPKSAGELIDRITERYKCRAGGENLMECKFNDTMWALYWTDSGEIESYLWEERPY